MFKRIMYTLFYITLFISTSVQYQPDDLTLIVEEFGAKNYEFIYSMNCILRVITYMYLMHNRCHVCHYRTIENKIKCLNESKPGLLIIKRENVYYYAYNFF